MRILLQDLETGLYFIAPGQWTQNPAEARSFASGDLVIDMAKKYGIAKAAMFYQFSDATQNFSVPIPKGLD